MVKMSLVYYLQNSGKFKANKFPKDIHGLIKVETTDNGIFVCQVTDVITNLHNKYELLATAIELTEPIGNYDFIFVSEGCESGYWFEIRDKKVRVYSAIPKFDKSDLIFE